MPYALGAIARNPSTEALVVIVDHVWTDGLCYAFVDPKLPYRPWVMHVNRFDAQHELVEQPFYEVGKLNTTTWSVHYPAPGRNHLKHVFASVDSLFAAQRMAVTQNVLRAAARQPG
jgi:hypothetical protein